MKINDQNLRTIFITGAARTGTTWMGKIIAEASGIKYIHEPFSPDNKCSPIKYYLEFINDQTDPVTQKEINDYLYGLINSYQKYLTNYFVNLLQFRKLSKIFSDDYFLGNKFKILNFIKSPFSNRTLFKAPSSVISAEWVSTSFYTDTIILIRHPAAFAASYKISGWNHDFNHFRLQTNLMNNHLSQFREQVNLFSYSPPDIVDQAILLWNIIYTFISRFYQKYRNDWYFIRHEDLSNDPITEFGKIFLFLGIEFTDKIKNSISKSTNGHKIGYLKRNSKQNIWTWKERLTAEEIDRIRLGTRDIAKNFYSDEDWK